MPYEAQSTLGSKVQIAITAVDTDIPGTQNITITGEDNVSFETGDIADDVNSKKASGVAEPGTLSFSMLFDPSDTVHKHLQSVHNTGGSGVAVDMTVFISATGGTRAATCNFKKFDLKAEKKGGWMADVEMECLDRWTIVDPS